MAPLSKILPWTAVLASLATAIPLGHHARDIVIVTEVDWVTVDSTVTVYQDQPTPGPAQLVESAGGPPPEPTSDYNPQPSSPPVYIPVQYDQVGTSTSTSTTAQSPPSSYVPPPVAPVPTTSTTAPPQPTTLATSTSTSVAPPPANTVSNSPAPSSPPSSSGSGSYSGQCSEGSPCSGDLTYYDTSTSASNPSFCDTTNDGLTENVLALPYTMMDQSHCGKSVTIEYGGNTVTGTVVDKCMGCKPEDVDLSRCFFSKVVGSLGPGRVSGAKWYISS